MGLPQSVDSPVTNLPQTQFVLHDDPSSKLFFDHRTAAGYRLMAVAEPVHHNTHGFLTASAALAAFEEALLVAISGGAEAGLRRAFEAANSAVRAANRTTAHTLRTYAGITAAVVIGSEAVIGTIPPGQALLIQDNRLYGIPDLASWDASFIPADGMSSPEPLGLSAAARPFLRNTAVGLGDQIVVGSSAVGRVLASRGLPSGTKVETDELVQTMEHALEDSNVDDAFAAWMRFDAVPAPSISPERMAEIERTWWPVSGGEETAQPASAEDDTQRFLQDRRYRRNIKADRVHVRLIEVSERLLGGKGPGPLPLEGSRRAALPPGAGSLDRYMAPHVLSVRPGIRCRLPRGPRLPFSRKVGFLLLIVIVSASLAAFNYDGRQARAERKDHYLTEARTSISQAAEGTGEFDVLLADADRSLELAERHGASDEQVTELRQQVATMRDEAHGVTRLDGMTKIAALPGGAKAETRIMLIGDELYVISGGVYAVDPVVGEFKPMLEPGSRVGQLTAGQIRDGTVDEGTLVVSDGQTVFTQSSEGTWRAASLAAPSAGDIWAGPACGAFKGNFYMLRSDEPGIMKFTSGEYAAEPQNWLTSSATAKLNHPVDMVVDGKIHVLLANGTIQTFFKGKAETTHVISPEPNGITEIAMFVDPASSYMYVIERKDGAGELVRYDAAKSQSALFMAKDEAFAAYDPAASAAFDNATDFVVDGATGTVYFVADGELWQAKIV